MYTRLGKEKSAATGVRWRFCASIRARSPWCVGTAMELPAGKLEAGEDPKECARRELFEETGLSAGKLEELGVYCSAPDVLEEKMHLYWAEDLSLGQARPDEGEFLEGEFWERPRLKDALRRGKIRDAKTLCARFLAREKGLLSL